MIEGGNVRAKREQLTDYNYSLFPVDSEERGHSKDVVGGVGDRGVIVGADVPETPGAHFHRLARLLLAQGHSAHVLVPHGEHLMLHAPCDLVGQPLGEIDALLPVVLPRVLKIRLQALPHDSLSGARVKCLVLFRHHAVCVFQGDADLDVSLQVPFITEGSWPPEQTEKRVYLLLDVFFEGLYIWIYSSCRHHRVTSGLFTSSNLTEVK